MDEWAGGCDPGDVRAERLSTAKILSEEAGITSLYQLVTGGIIYAVKESKR